MADTDEPKPRSKEKAARCEPSGKLQRQADFPPQTPRIAAGAQSDEQRFDRIQAVAGQWSHASPYSAGISRKSEKVAKSSFL
jgi:hypothetical protein